MKYLTTYKLFESDKLLPDLDKINDILLDLIDENWVITINYSPKRWHSSGESDYIKIVIKKKQNARQSNYPPESEFKPSIISDHTLRILDNYKNNNFTINYCKIDKTLYYGKNTGLWENGNINILTSDDPVVGIEIKIYLNGENLDNFNSIPLLKREFNISESKLESTKLKFIKQPKKKGAKTDVYNVSKNGITIGQIKWSSRLRGYGFLPTKDCDSEVKDFIKDLMRIRREENKNNK